VKHKHFIVSKSRVVVYTALLANSSFDFYKHGRLHVTYDNGLGFPHLLRILMAIQAKILLTSLTVSTVT